MSRSTPGSLSLLGTLILAAAFPFSLAAQALETGEEGPAPRIHAGVAGAVAQPLGEFSDYVTLGGGLRAFLRWDLEPGGRAALRLGAGFLNYGNETRRVCLGGGVGCRIQVDLTTSNNILLLSVGPELAMPVGPARLYGHGGVGISYFSTDSRVSGTGDPDPFASSQNFGDGGFSWSGGAGVQLPLARVREIPISFDFGMAYQGNGRREYLTRGDITDLPDGSLEFDPKRSQTDFLLWTIGVSVGVRRDG